jgi:DNA-binding NarL/FixJ family response regulator
MSIRVFLVDDHEVVRRGLRDLLESADMEVVGEAGTAAQAIARIPALQPDVCVLDYVLKQVGGDDLIEAIQHVAAGRSLLDPAVTQRVLERMRTGGSDEPKELASLTDQERKILALIAEGLTNRQIGERMFLAEKTVKNYVSSVLAKLGLERRTQAAVLAAKLLH